MQEFQSNGKLVKGFNSSFIVLIPKVNNPTSLDEYRPISLTGCLDKVLAKLLSIRLRKVISSVVSHSQTTFVSDRQILDGVLILNEVIHELNSKKRSGFILKADFSKAFDYISWSYLDNVMSAMGFGLKWWNWISSCLSSASIFVLVNESPTSVFNISKGLCQGDPLSPFLFILVDEGFNILIEAASTAGLFSGIKIGVGNFTLTHLQYADNTIIIGESTTDNIVGAKFILKCCELVSGLRINFKKIKLITINCSSYWSQMQPTHLTAALIISLPPILVFQLVPVQLNLVSGSRLLKEFKK